MPKKAELRKIERDDGRAARWGISIPQSSGRPKRKFFTTAKQRDVEFKKFRRLTNQEGPAVLDLSSSDVVLLRDLRSMLPANVDPREAVRFYIEHNCPDTTVSFNEGMFKFLAKQELKGISEIRLKAQALALKRLHAGVGDCSVAEVTHEQISTLLMGLMRTMAKSTARDYQKKWGTFFNWCVKQNYCAKSPLANIDPIIVPESEPEFMPLNDAITFFHTAYDMHPEYTPVLALAFFAGIRSSHIMRLERSDLVFEQQAFRLRGNTHKSGRRYFVQGFPDNLWEWLEPWRKLKRLPEFPSSSGIKIREKIYKAAGVVFPHNAGRHSFCTYHVALCGSADRTATLLTHRGSVSMLYDHYRGNATRDDAEKYFSITP